MKSKLDILTFHRVMPRGDNYFIPPMAITESTFSDFIERLASTKRLIALEEGVQKLASGKLDGNRVAITFDDGYLDNFTLARKVLLRTGAPATFFIPVNPIENQRPYWWDHLHNLLRRVPGDFLSWLDELEPSDLSFSIQAAIKGCKGGSNDEVGRSLVRIFNGISENGRRCFMLKLERAFGPYQGPRQLMNWEEVQKLSKDGFSIGSHSYSHIPLTDLHPENARHEIADSAEILENRLGHRPIGFCYPRGAYSEEHIGMVQDSGYRFAVTTQFGSNSDRGKSFALRRRNIADYQGARSLFPVTMHLLELSGRLDRLLASRRSA